MTHANIDFTDILASESRKYWWHDDYLDLLGKRAHLSNAKKVLDVGTGTGRWLNHIAHLVSQDAQLIGIDMNPALIEEAKKSFISPISTQTIEFKTSSAYSLPFPDNTFDLVTCQTLLMHLGNPKEALLEMHRVLKPGGVAIIAEPNNYANIIRSNSAQEKLTIKERLEIVELYATIEKGKEMLGEGQLNITVRIPDMLNELGFEQRQLYKNDTVFQLYPPYDTKEMISFAKFFQSLVKPNAFFLFNAQDTKRYFLAANNNIEKFKILIKTSNKLNKFYDDDLKNQTLSGDFSAEFLIHIAKKASP